LGIVVSIILLYGSLQSCDGAAVPPSGHAGVGPPLRPEGHHHGFGRGLCHQLRPSAFLYFGHRPEQGHCTGEPDQLFWGTNWSAAPELFTKRSLRNDDRTPDLLIGCVDTRAARRAIDRALTAPSQGTTYWLDLGNNAASGQYILGQPLNWQNRRKAERLRTVSELYPEIVDADAGEDALPSCSAVEALKRQEPFINQTLASSALAMLSQLFRYGKLAHHGGFFNAQTGRMSSVPVNPELWAKTRRRNRRLLAA
jgi:hypothetical protein